MSTSRTKKSQKSKSIGTAAVAMRIMHLNTARTWRGGERQTLLLAEELHRRGADQLLVCPPDSPLGKKARDLGINVYEIPMRGELDFWAAYRLRKLCRSFGADIIHAHTAKAHGLGLLIRRRLPNLCLVVSRRVDFPFRKNFLSRHKYVSPHVDRYIAISLNVRNILIRDGIPSEKIGLAYSALDRERLDHAPDSGDLPDEFGIKRNEFILGNVAALVDHKDQKTLLQALSYLPDPGTKIGRKKFPSFRLFMIGEGKLRFVLEEQAARLGLLKSGRIVFTGFRQDVLSFYRIMHLFVMSSKEEGLGTSVLDAMGCELPVVCTVGGGLPEMIDTERGGLLTPVGDARALSFALERIMLDPTLGRKMGRYNQKKVDSFSVRAMTDSVIENYATALHALPNQR